MPLSFGENLFGRRDVRETPAATATATSVGLTDGQYVVLANHADMTAERVLTAGAGIDITDGGANSTVTIDGESASTTNPGIIEVATGAETNTGTSATLAVSPDALDDWTGSAQITTVGTLSAGDVDAAVTAASTTAQGKVELATSAETQTGTDATRAVTPDGAFDVICPVGAIVAWAKTMTGVPQTLPAGWVECDGAAISDAESPMDGENVPDLNGNEFLRGAATSGGTGGGTTGAGSAHSHNDTFATGNESSHTHSLSTASNVGLDSSTYRISSTNTGTGTAHNHSVTGSVSNESSHTHLCEPKYYDVVWIIRIK